MFTPINPGENATQSWWDSHFRMGAGHFKSYFVDEVAYLPHTHGEYAFIICLHGKMEFLCGGQHILLEAGEFLVHNPGQIHQSRYGSEQSPCEGVALVVEKPVMESLLKRMIAPHRLHLNEILFLGKTHDQGVIRLAQDLICELEQHRSGYEILLQSLVVQILVHMFRYCLEPTIVKPKSLSHQLPVWQMNKAMDYMSARGKKNFSLSELCAEIGSSRSRCIALFRNSTQLTPGAYFNLVLMKKAQRLLHLEGCSVKHVAYELGFENVSHFCSLFQNVTGMTAKTYQLLAGNKSQTPPTSGSKPAT
jgi:AraC-like DNA-binding protein